jgi:REP element-mobilizing transposase RayT
MEQDRYYHIYNRGNNNDTLFYEDENYDYFIKKYRFYLDKYVDTLCYCLMKTHFHFLIKVKDIEPNISDINPKSNLTPLEKAFKDFFISYAKSINKKYHRTGSLFQYKFKRKEITDNFYLKNIIRYIHYNPVVSGYCLDPEYYAYSSYQFHLRNDNTWLASDLVIDIFGDINEFKNFHHQSAEQQEQDFKGLGPDIKSF